MGKKAVVVPLSRGRRGVFLFTDGKETALGPDSPYPFLPRVRGTNFLG
jgi:hypothetical protein